MIVYFSVSNFKSFKDKVEFNMLAGNYKRFPEHVCTEVTPNLLRATALYGNNGAGKSNLIIAMEKLRSIVIGELEVEHSEDLRCFKLDPECINKPVEFEIEFITNDNRYNYHISFLKGKIIEEWLVKVLPNNKLEDLFERKIHNSKTVLTVGDKKKLKKSVKEQLRMEIYAEELDKKGNKPFILDGIDKQIKSFEEPFNWFYYHLNVVRSSYAFGGRVISFEDEMMHDLAKVMIKSLHLGIEDIRVESISLEDFLGKGDNLRIEELKKDLDEFDEPIFLQKGLVEYTIHKKNEKYWASKLVTIHKGGVEFELFEESTGTQKIIELLPSIVGAILEEKVYIFDEIENSKHPEVMKELIELYLSAGSDHKGQLIFSTHECNLLDLNLLRQDEIWFAEKDYNGISHIYSLSDFKPRYDKDIRRGYLDGQFTTIPFFTHPADLNWNKYEQTSKRR